MPARLRISLKKNPAMVVSRVAIDDLKLVYAACASKKLKYPTGSSPVIYIGTTEKGVERLFTSASYRADAILSEHGVDSFEVRVVTCRPRRRVRTWKKLERAMLLAFKERYGEVPKLNIQGKGMTEGNEFSLFSKARVVAILDGLEKHGLSRGRPVTKGS